MIMQHFSRQIFSSRASKVFDVFHVFTWYILMKPSFAGTKLVYSLITDDFMLL